MPLNGLYCLLTGLLMIEVLNCHSMKRQLRCQKDGQTFEEGTIYTSKNCRQTCSCQDDGEFVCQPCEPDKKPDECQGWTRELVKVAFEDNSEECDCFRYECSKRTFKSILKHWWQKLKNKFSDEYDEELVQSVTE